MKKRLLSLLMALVLCLGLLPTAALAAGGTFRERVRRAIPTSLKILLIFRHFAIMSVPATAIMALSSR